MPCWLKPPIAVCLSLAFYAVALAGALLVRIGRVGKVGMRMETWALKKLGLWAE
jgi:hypothetical protein